MTYYYIVDNALLENNLTIFEDENEFQDSLNFNLDEAIENEALTPEEANIIVDDFNEYTEVEQEVNGFTYGKTSDKEDLLKTYSLKVEDCDTTDVKIEDDAYGDWRYIIRCEGNEWEEDGFDSVEEAKDNALAKVNELLEDFPEGYVVDDFDLTFENDKIGESCTYDPYHSTCHDDGYIEQIINQDYDDEDVNEAKNNTSEKGKRLLYVMGSANDLIDEKIEEALKENGFKNGIDFEFDGHSGWTGFNFLKDKASADKVFDDTRQKILEELNKALLEGDKCDMDKTDLEALNIRERHFFGDAKSGESCTHTPRRPKCKDSQAQEIGEEYRRLSEKYGVDMDELVYGKDGFMNSCYPHNPDYVYFPDFNGDVIFSEKHWNELVDWAKKNRGIDLEPKNEGNFWDSDSKKSNGKIVLILDTDLSTAHANTPQGCAYKWDGNEPLEKFALRCYNGDWKNGELVRDFTNEHHDEFDIDEENKVLTLVDWGEDDKGADDKITRFKYDYYFDGQELCKKDYVGDSSQNLFKDTDDCDTIEISDEEVNVPFNQNISFDELRDIFYDHNSENGIKGQFEDKAPLYGNVVISQDSFNKPYSEEERTYVFRSDNKAFLSDMIGNSIISDSKDGSDKGVRLDWYIWDGWKIERCYITKEE